MKKETLAIVIFIALMSIGVAFLFTLQLKDFLPFTGYAVLQFGDFCDPNAAPPYGNECDIGYPCQLISGFYRCYCPPSAPVYRQQIQDNFAVCCQSCPAGYDDSTMPQPSDTQQTKLSLYCDCLGATLNTCSESDTVNNAVCYHQAATFQDPGQCEMNVQPNSYCCLQTSIFGQTLCQGATCSRQIEIINWP